MKKSGVYEIVCISTGMRYIGSSIDLDKRINKHKRMLKTLTHHNTHLQSAYNKYGVDKFVINILAYLEKYECLGTEQRLLDAASKNTETLFNYAISATAPMTGKTHTEEARKKIGSASRGNSNNAGRVLSKEQKATLSAAQKKRFSKPEEMENHLRIMRDPEVRERIAKSNKARLRDINVRLALSSKIKEYFNTDGARERSSEAQIARFKTKEGQLGLRRMAELYEKQVECITLNTIFSSAKEAAEMTGLSKSGVSKVCLGQRKQANGLVFNYINGV